MQVFCACGSILDVKTAIGDDAGPFKCPRCAGARVERRADRDPRRGDFVVVAQEHPFNRWDASSPVSVGVVTHVRRRMVDAYRDTEGVEHAICGAVRMVAAKEGFRVPVRKLIAAIAARFGAATTLGDVQAFAGGFRR